MGTPAAREPETTLETGRLLLRPMHPSDAPLQHELWTERDPRVPPHRRIGPDGRPTVEDLEAWIREDHPGPALGLLTIEHTGSGERVGYCGLISNDLLPEAEPELAYELLRRAWGQGYATEASRAVLGWARAAGYGRLWATVRDWNAASLRVLSTLGFTASGRGPRGLALLDQAALAAAATRPGEPRSTGRRAGGPGQPFVSSSASITTMPLGPRTYVSR